MRREQLRIEVEPGVHLFCEVVGDGPQVVLVTIACFLSQDLDPLAAGRTLVFVDPRGRGGSDRVDDIASLSGDSPMDDLERVRQHIGCEQVGLIGWSAGGAFACGYGMDHPERTSRILTIGFVPPRATSPAQEEIAGYWQQAMARLSAEEQEEVEALRRSGLDRSNPVAFARAEILARMPFQMGRPEARRRMRSQPWQYENEWGDRWREIHFHVQQAPRRERTPVVTPPALVMYGDEEFVRLGPARDWRWAFDDGRLLQLPGVGHWPWLEDPDEFFPSAERFLSGEWPDGTEPIG